MKISYILQLKDFCILFAIGIGLGGGVIGSRRTPLAGGCLLVGIGVGAIACAGDGVGEGPSHPA